MWADLSGHACESSVELRRWSEDLVWWYYSAILESILELSFTAQRDPFSHSRAVGRALFGAKRFDVKSVSLIQRDT